MIVDKIENIGLYVSVLEGLDKAGEFVNSFYKNPGEPGRYEQDGDKVFANVSSYKTKPREGAQFEAHRKYADLQAVISGTELIGWSPLGSLKEESESFSSGGDIAFYSGGSMLDVVLPAGYFVLLLPEDAHMPCIQADGEGDVTKIVVKIRMSAV